MKGIPLFLQGLKLLTALCCIVAALVQSIELVQNYNLKETIWKKQEEIYHGEMPTPILIFCTDPPDSNHEDIIKHADQNSTVKPPVVKFNTILKVNIELIYFRFKI